MPSEAVAGPCQRGLELEDATVGSSVRRWKPAVASSSWLLPGSADRMNNYTVSASPDLSSRARRGLQVLHSASAVVRRA